MEEGTKILIVVKEAEARAAYEEALHKIGARYDVAASFRELLRLSTDNSYNGLLVDLLTLVRSSKEEKTIAYECLNFYPSLRVKWDARNKCMNLSPLEQSHCAAAEETLEYFIQKRCKPFTPRSLRKFDRKETFLPMRIAGGSGFAAGATLKTFTVNISRGGAFIHTCEPPAKGETVWLHFAELPDAEPVQAEVCWRMEWGISRNIPGIGVRFQAVSEGTAELIKSMAKL